ncbi:MAG: hypothetical protein B7Z80_19305 [Rhodospirillales bacterium 20-64-7]|nr:MAG: hypothetical protein B7Z80_19305 [Rhodospirillales bacterium 20-64-7]
MDDPVDAVAPWTIKAVSTTTRNAVTESARKEGLTVGQWLERRVREWLADGGPVTVAETPPPQPVDLGDLAHAMTAAHALATAAGVPVPPSLAKDALALVRRAIRQTKPPARQKLLQGPTEKPAGPAG